MLREVCVLFKRVSLPSDKKPHSYGRRLFAVFLSFKAPPQSYKLYSLDHFVSEGLRERDLLLMQTARRGLDSMLEVAFGDIFFRGVCDGTIRPLNRGKQIGIDLGFVRNSLELALRAWCKLIRSTSPIRPGVASRSTFWRQDVCGAAELMPLGNMSVRSKDIEAF